MYLTVDAALHLPSIAASLLFRFHPLAGQGGYSCCLRLLHNDVVLRRNPAQTATIFSFLLFFFTFSCVPFAALSGRQDPGWASGAAVGLLFGKQAREKKSQINSIRVVLPTQAENPASCCGEPVRNSRSRPLRARLCLCLCHHAQTPARTFGSRQPGATSRNSN
ncbi:hypothetical protein V8C26DRAFT_394524 [Trichoderma gracile]